jgi:hypothetical protein
MPHLFSDHINNFLYPGRPIRRRRVHIHNRTVNDKVFEAWRSPDRFTKNPDIVQIESGRLLLVYSDNDQHWSQENQILTILASDDLGRTWSKLSEVDRADLSKGDERLVTPRLSYFRDGRLAVIIDHDDFGHFHEDQPPGNWIYWSADGGETWTDHQTTEIKGFEPDRIMELPDGRLAICTHVMRRESQEFAEILSCSDDGGKSWYENSTIAHDGYHRFCEGALVILDNGKELACVMRENHSAGIASFVSFSRNNGNTWTPPQMMPFALHRPYAKQLADGRVMVTGRHVNGGLGTYAWVGNLKAEAGTYATGGPRRKYDASLSTDALVVTNKADHECRYTLLPAESSKSEILFEAEIRIEADHDEPVAFISLSRPRQIVIQIARNWVGAHRGNYDLGHQVDMTAYHTISVTHKQGLIQLLCDGEVFVQGPVYWEHPPISDHIGGDPMKRTQFGQIGASGTSYWRTVRYEVKNPNLPPYSWEWMASSGEWPDQYQRDRMIQIHANSADQKPGPDHGYSSWLTLEDGRIILVDYTNCGDKPTKSHIVGVFLELEDIR